MPPPIPSNSSSSRPAPSHNITRPLSTLLLPLLPFPSPQYLLAFTVPISFLIPHLPTIPLSLLSVLTFFFLFHFCLAFIFHSYYVYYFFDITSSSFPLYFPCHLFLVHCILPCLYCFSIACDDSSAVLSSFFLIPLFVSPLFPLALQILLFLKIFLALL